MTTYQYDYSITNRSKASKAVLPIRLLPDDKNAFKEEFLITGYAEIREYHDNGNIEIKPWSIRPYGGFCNTSGILNNLRSKSRYRQGVWQELGIRRLEVEVKRK